jgi:hypothetical protein
MKFFCEKLQFPEKNEEKWSKEELETIKQLLFMKQVKVFYSSSGMWEHNVRPI